MTLAERIAAASERRALSMRASYIAAIGRPTVYAPPVEPVAEWVRRALESRLAAKELSR